MKFKVKKRRANPDDYVREISERLPVILKADRYRYITGRALRENRRDKWMTTAKEYIKEFLARGYTSGEIQYELGIDDKVYEELEADIIEIDAAKFVNYSVVHRYYLYVLRQEMSLRQLENFINSNPTSYKIVSAIKAKSQILTETMRMGQELGVVEKRAKDIRVLGDINLTKLPNDELQHLFERQIRRFANVVESGPQLEGPHLNIVQNALEGKKNEVIEAEYEEVENN